MQQREERGRRGVGRGGEAGRRGDWVEVPVSTEGEAARLTYAIQVFWGLRRLVCRKITKVGFPPSLPPWSQRKMQYTHGSPSWEQLLQFFEPCKRLESSCSKGWNQAKSRTEVGKEWWGKVEGELARAPPLAAFTVLRPLQSQPQSPEGTGSFASFLFFFFFGGGWNLEQHREIC